MYRALLLALCSWALLFAGCDNSPQAECVAGREGCICASGNTCISGLWCVAGICQRDTGGAGSDPPAPGGGPEGGSGGNAGTGAAGDSPVVALPDGGHIEEAAVEEDSSPGDPPDGSGVDGETPADTGGDPIDCPAPRPVIFVHGINGSSANFSVMMERMAADGWPQDYLIGFDAADPSWGCNVDNAAAIKLLVDEVMQRTGFDRVDLVAHSMGTLSSRYYIKNLGGQEVVNTYVTLGGMHHGLDSPCWSPVGMQCTWDELCGTREFLTQLNAPPATPGELHWVSIYGTADNTVPNSSSYLEGAENISLEGVTHSGPDGLEQSAEAYAEIKRVLQYPCW